MLRFRSRAAHRAASRPYIFEEEFLVACRSGELSLLIWQLVSSCLMALRLLSVTCRRDMPASRKLQMKVPAPIICRCAVVDNKIQFCALHENAQTLLDTCEYVRKFLADRKFSNQERGVMQRAILAHLNNVIAAVRKQSS